MIRGGGPEAWRHLDLADEERAQSKPSPLPILLPLLYSFFSTLRLVILLLPATRSPHPPPTRGRFYPRPVHQPVTGWILLSLDHRTSSSAIALHHAQRTFFSRFVECRRPARNRKKIVQPSSESSRIGNARSHVRTEKFRWK